MRTGSPPPRRPTAPAAFGRGRPCRRIRAKRGADRRRRLERRSPRTRECYDSAGSSGGVLLGAMRGSVWAPLRRRLQTRARDRGVLATVLRLGTVSQGFGKVLLSTWRFVRRSPFVEERGEDLRPRLHERPEPQKDARRGELHL